MRNMRTEFVYFFTFWNLTIHQNTFCYIIALKIDRWLDDQMIRCEVYNYVYQYLSTLNYIVWKRYHNNNILILINLFNIFVLLLWYVIKLILG